MIKIHVNGQPLELRADTAVNLRFRNPMFHDEGTYSLPVKIDNTIVNRKILGFPNRIGNAGIERPVYDCEIVANSFRLKGSLVIQTVDDSKITAFYTDGNGEFSNLAKDKYLTDIDDDNIDFDTSQDLYDDYTATINKNYPDTKYVCFPIRNLSAFDGTSHVGEFVTAGGYYNKWDITNQQFVNNYRIPNFFLCYVIEKLFETFGYNIKDNFIYNNSELRQLVLISDYFKHGPYTTYYFSPIIPSSSKYYINIAEVVPKYDIKSFIINLRKFLLCEFFINNYSKSVTIISLKELITQSDYIDITDLADEQYEIEFEDETDGYIIGQNTDTGDEILEEIPDINALNRLDDVDSYEDLPDILGQPLLHNSIALVRNRDKFYAYYYDSVLGHGWYELCQNFIKDESGDKELDFASDISRVTNFTFTWLTEFIYDIILPEIKIAAFDFPEHPLADKGVSYNVSNFQLAHIRENAPRLAFWHGKLEIRQNYNGFEHLYYPFASGDIYYISKSLGFTKIPGKTIALTNSGEDSYTKLYSPEYLYWYFNIRKKVERPIRWQPIDIHNLDFSKKYRINNQNYFIAAIDITINSSGDMEVGKTEMYTV